MRIKSVGMDVDVKIGVFMTMSKTVRILMETLEGGLRWPCRV